MKNGSKVIEGDLKDFVLQLNSERSHEYTDPSAQLARQLYRQQHPTEFLVAKCMDGRLNLSVFTEVPPGIIQPFRNIGGRFDLGWPFFQEVVNDGVQYAVNKGRQCVFVSSYHFSKSDTHRGCAGFGYDTEAAKNAAFNLRDQFTRVFGTAKGRPVYAFTIGIETDAESLVFHSTAGDILDVATLKSDTTNEEIEATLLSLYGDMDNRMRADIIPLIAGNIRHIKEVTTSQKPLIDLEHREQIIAVGRGFDWLHQPNRALIIGPYSHEWPSAVETAGKIVVGNLAAERIPKESGILLLVSALWRSEEREVGRRLKEEKVKYLYKVALEKLKNIPELSNNLHHLVGVVDADTREFHQVDV